ncbi:MAG: HAD family hydrolase [Massiliimalia sp.]
MIRLIASDLDGTLLDDQKRIPPEFFPTVKEWSQKGVLFAAASGRSYPKVEEEFRQGTDDMYFICDNGAAVWHRGELLYSRTIPDEEVKALLQELTQCPDVLPILCGLNGAYHPPFPKGFEKHVCTYYSNDQVVEDLFSVSDGILKIAVCDLKGPQNNSYAVLTKKFGDQYNFAVSGAVWMDIMVADVDKGKGLQMIQEKYGISREETLAFGDYYNDVELLQQAEFSYVMENANEDMKQYGKFIAPSNNDQGVMKVILQYLKDCNLTENENI